MTQDPTPCCIPRRGRPGRRLGPIVEGAGPFHQVWVEELRNAFRASGLTLAELKHRTGWPTSKISELLRAAGRYPRWTFVCDIRREVASPGWPCRTLQVRWVEAALEANKRTKWIINCLSADGGSFADGSAPVPLGFFAFREMHQSHYLSDAVNSLHCTVTAQRAVTHAFALLLVLWPAVLTCGSPERYAVQILRRTVLEQAPKYRGGTVPTYVEVRLLVAPPCKTCRVHPNACRAAVDGHFNP